MKKRRPYLNDYQRKTVRHWWQALQPKDADKPKADKEDRHFYFDRGDRAVLRRATTLDEQVLAGAVGVLWQALFPAATDAKAEHEPGMADYERLGFVAAILAHVTTDAQDGRSLAWRLGHGFDKKREKPLLNELRFHSLIKATDLTDLYRQFVRAVRLADGCTDVVELADDIFTWLWQARLPTVNPGRNVKLYWAHDYYLSAKQQADVASAQEEESKA